MRHSHTAVPQARSSKPIDTPESGLLPWMITFSISATSMRISSRRPRWTPLTISWVVTS